MPVQRNVLIEPAGDFVNFVPDRVRVAVTFAEKIGSQTFEDIPITLRNGRATSIDPPQVALTVRGPELELKRLERPDGAVFVDASGLAPGRHELEVQVDLPVPFEVTKRKPQRVRVVVAPPETQGDN